MERSTRQSTRAAFWEGFTTPLRGFRYLIRRPKLWRYGLMPILLNVLLTAFILLFAIVGVIAFATYIHPRFEPSGFGQFLEALSAVGLLLLLVGVAVGSWLILQGTLGGYYHGKLAEQVELQLGMKPEDVVDVRLKHQMADASIDLASLVAINSACLLLNIVPIFGSIAGVFGAFYFDCYILGTDYLNFPLDLRGKRRKEKRAIARRYRWQTIGLGAAVLLGNLVPLFGAILLTSAAVGAVLLYRRLEQDDRAECEPTDRERLGHGPKAVEADALD